jgi:hypothetical protein
MLRAIVSDVDSVTLSAKVAGTERLIKVDLLNGRVQLAGADPNIT